MPDHNPSATAHPSDEAQEALALFGAHVAELQSARHQKGLSYAITDRDGHVVHIYPDGTVHGERVRPVTEAQ